MSRTDVFIDTNVLVYLSDTDLSKARRSAEILAAGGVVSVQVLNEFILVARRKMLKPWPDVRAMLAAIRPDLLVVPVTEDIHQRGLLYSERYGFRIFDSMLLAAAVLASCSTFFSQDLNDGQVIDGLTIRNPYAGP